MRLSEWHEKAPDRELLGDEVLAVLRPALVGLGAEADSECWIAWGDEPKAHYSVLAPTAVGLVKVNVRPADAEGPRAIARLIRWSKLSMTELGIDASVGRRVVGVQVEGLVLEGVDEQGDRICEFVRGLIAGVEGRIPVPVPVALGRGAASVGQDVADAAATPAKTTSAGSAESKSPAARKQASAPSPKIVPITSKAASRSAADAAASPPASAPEPPDRPSAPRPVEPPAPPAPPTPIAARAAAARRGELPPAATIHPVPDSEPEQGELIGLRPEEEPPADEPPRPRPWMP